MAAYKFYRSQYPEITKQDIDGYITKYRGSDEEKTDLVEFYTAKRGDVRRILEHVIGSRNEDVERFLRFFDGEIEKGGLPRYTLYASSREKVRPLKEEKMPVEEEQRLGDLQRQIVHKNSGKPSLFDLLEEKYAPKRGRRKTASPRPLPQASCEGKAETRKAKR